MIRKLLLLFSLVLCFGCSKSAPASPKIEKPLVLVSIAPYQFLVEAIAGSTVEVQTVVPSSANPHSYEPTSSQVSSMLRAGTWFRIGEPFEEKILPIFLRRNPDLKVLDLRIGIELLEEGHMDCHHCSMDHFDRHIWLSPKLASLQAGEIARVLSEQFPDKKEFFTQNLKELQTKLIQLDAEIFALLAEVKDRVILVSHPAFGYFCRDYHFEQLSVEYEGKDPRPKHLEQILKKAAFHRAEIALALPQYNNKGAQLIAEKLHLPVHFIDPYSPDYFINMRKLAHLIANPTIHRE
ncbi:MAG: zinc ABC transporter substrate-binding protein [Chlamydiota bacterium]